MLNLGKFWGIIAFIAIIVFSFLSCDENLNVLSGTVTITGTAQVGQSLSADISALGGNGVVTFQWARGGTIAIGSDDTYMVQIADIGSTITVTVSRTGSIGNITSAPTALVQNIAFNTLTNIAISNEPIKTVYFAGETLNLSGLLITATYSDNSTKTVTGYTTNPVSGAILNNVGSTTVEVSYAESGTTRTTSFNITVNHVTLTGISVTNTPTKTEYFTSESFDINGLVITATYSDSSTKTVTGYTTNPVSGAVLNSVGSTTVNVIYTEGDISKSTSFNITVNAPLLTAISLSNEPSKTTYLSGETLNLNGLEITAFYSNGSSKTVTGYATNPANGTVLNNVGSISVQVSYTENDITKSVSFNIFVNTNLGIANITLETEQIIDEAPIFDNITISRTGIGFPVTYLVSVDASSFDHGSIRWLIDGVGIYLGTPIIENGSSFKLNAADIRYNSLGNHFLILTVTKNGIQYQRAIPFTIIQ